MICKTCGTELPDNATFCSSCGATTTAPAPQPQPQYAAPQYVAPQPAAIPEQNRPLSPWAYWGLQILFAIPIIGFIFLIIFSINGSNINRRNFARSYWCTFVLVAIIFFILLVTGASLGGLEYMF